MNTHRPSTPHSGPSGWQRFSAAVVRGFHAYAAWLVGISWKRFFLLAVLLMIGVGILHDLPPFTWTITEQVTEHPAQGSAGPPPKPPKVPAIPGVHIDKSIRIEKSPAGDAPGEGVDISIDERGIRIVKRPAAPASAPAAASAPAPAASGMAPPDGGASGAAVAGAAVAQGAGSSGANGATPAPDHKGGKDGKDGSLSIQITVPPGADTQAVREAIREAEREISEAVREAQGPDGAGAITVDIADDDASTPGTHVRVRTIRYGDFLPQLALLWIVASIVIKITYKGRLQAEVKAAQATETAEAEQLKRQVAEARMAAMQAQVEPHFLFNTLASIDHLIETDPPRASRMQKSLIALLRATMPSLRESGAQGGQRQLGQEVAVVEPYLDILKVRMEERLATDIDVPAGLRSAEFPPMMLQGLVENAIKHGLEPQPEGGRLSVRAEIVDGELAVTVTDTGVGFGQADTAGAGTGLANIRERLQLLYGHRARLEVAGVPGGGTRATIRLPYKAHVPQGATG
jgi:signal transduction histidine kinase